MAEDSLDPVEASESAEGADLAVGGLGLGELPVELAVDVWSAVEFLVELAPKLVRILIASVYFKS